MAREDDIRAHLQASVAVFQAVLQQMGPQVAAAVEAVVQALKGGGKVMLFGNGGSAAQAQHAAAELTGRYRRERRALAAIALTTDTSALTAIGNDYGIERVFERQLEALARPGDVAVALSTSGRSPNVLRAVEAAKRLRIFVIALTGGDGGALAGRADLALVIPSGSTPQIQEAHLALLHVLCDGVERELGGS